MARIRVVRHAADALADPPQVDWVVHDLFIRPSLNVLVGDPGSKKTLLALDLATCLALGKPWLGRTTVPTPALYLDEETGIPRLWSRINGVLQAHGANVDTPFHYLSLSGYDLRDANEMNDLMEKILEVHAGLLVIDALADVIRGGDENSVLSTYPVLNYLRHMAEFTHAAILILHHTNKTGVFRGSSAIAAAVDLMLSIESPADSTLIHLRPLKTRDASPTPFSARIHFDANKFWLTAEEEHPTTKLGKVDKAVLQFLFKSAKATTPQLMRAIKHSAPASVRKAIHDLKASGYLARVNGLKRGRVAMFALTNEGRNTVKELENHDPATEKSINNSYSAYSVIPSAAKGGILVGWLRSVQPCLYHGGS
jgi:DNA-binding MarR family transcriptional regulator